MIPGRSRRVRLTGGVAALVALGVVIAVVLLRGPAAPQLRVPECSDAAYLKDVQDIVAFNGLKQVRAAGEAASTPPHRNCRLLARDANGREVRLRGVIRVVGADVQLSIEPE